MIVQNSSPLKSKSAHVIERDSETEGKTESREREREGERERRIERVTE